MKIILKIEDESGKERQLIISNENFSANFISLDSGKGDVLEVSVTELMSALIAFDNYWNQLNRES